MTRVIAIAIVAANGVIGDGEKQPFSFAEDWKRYKRVTLGHPIIMGRKTHEAIGRFLPGRTTIVVTSDPASVHIPDGADAVAVDSLDAALARAASLSDTVYVAGGGSIYRAAWPALTELDLTEVHADAEGAVRFPDVDPGRWREVRREPRGEFDFAGYAPITWTPRLRLWPVTLADEADWRALHTDPRTYEHAPEAMATDPAELQASLAANAAHWIERGLGYWKAVDAETGACVGFGGVRPATAGGQEFWNLYYRLAPSWQGRGLASEIARAAAERLALLFPDSEMRALVRGNNVASIRVATKLGLRRADDVVDPFGVPQQVYAARASDLVRP